MEGDGCCSEEKNKIFFTTTHFFKRILKWKTTYTCNDDLCLKTSWLSLKVRNKLLVAWIVRLYNLNFFNHYKEVLVQEAAFCLELFKINLKALMYLLLIKNKRRDINNITIQWMRIGRNDNISRYCRRKKKPE